jgi:hypothetical protein
MATRGTKADDTTAFREQCPWPPTEDNSHSRRSTGLRPPVRSSDRALSGTKEPRLKDLSARPGMAPRNGRVPPIRGSCMFGVTARY